MDRCTKTGCAILLGLLICRDCQADTPPPPPEPYGLPPAKLAPISVADVPFADVLKDLVLKRLPAEIVCEKNDNWGHQAHVPTVHGVKIVQVLRNHGNWQKMTVVCRDVPHSIRLRVEDLHYTADEVTYTVQLSLPATLEYHHKTWQNGIQVHGSHGRARMRVRAALAVQARIKWDGMGTVPAGDIRQFKVIDAKVVCDRFVAENVNGIGGDAARIAGGKLEHAFNSWKGTLEHDMLAKVQPVVLNAGSSKRGTLGLAQLVNNVSARATALALNPPFSSALVQPELAVLPPHIPAILQPEPQCAYGLSVFIDVKLNGRVDHGRASEHSSYVTSTAHGGHSYSSHDYGSHAESHSGHSSHSSTSSSADHSGHTHKK
jgi:hypothetical protein